MRTYSTWLTSGHTVLVSATSLAAAKTMVRAVFNKDQWNTSHCMFWSQDHVPAVRESILIVETPHNPMLEIL